MRRHDGRANLKGILASKRSLKSLCMFRILELRVSSFVCRVSGLGLGFRVDSLLFRVDLDFGD